MLAVNLSIDLSTRRTLKHYATSHQQRHRQNNSKTATQTQRFSGIDTFCAGTPPPVITTDTVIGIDNLLRQRLLTSFLSGLM
jgi:hypothetical protein